jgi:hypothetical protein
MNPWANCVQNRCEDKKFVIVFIVFMDDLETRCASKLLIYTCFHLWLWSNYCFLRIIMPTLSPELQVLGRTSASIFLFHRMWHLVLGKSWFGPLDGALVREDTLKYLLRIGSREWFLAHCQLLFPCLHMLLLLTFYWWEHRVVGCWSCQRHIW